MNNYTGYAATSPGRGREKVYPRRQQNKPDFMLLYATEKSLDYISTKSKNNFTLVYYDSTRV